MREKNKNAFTEDIIKKVDAKIKELEQEQEAKKKKDDIIDLDEIIKEIDKRINELEMNENKINIESLNEKINKKLSNLDDYKDDDLDRTIYDLSEIAKTVNETIKKLEAKKKEKKRKKAMYCDMARKQQNKKKNK